MNKKAANKRVSESHYSISKLDNEKAKIHNLKSHIQFKIGDMCAKSDCPVLAQAFKKSCVIETKRVRIYNEVPFEIWQRGKLLKKYEEGTWRDEMIDTVNRHDLIAFVPYLKAELMSSPCPYNVGFENWTKLIWLCQTYDELINCAFSDYFEAATFYQERVKKMYQVLEYSPNTCW